MTRARALCCGAVAVLALTLFAPACKHRRRKVEDKAAAPARVDAAASKPRPELAARPIARPDAAPPKGPEWCTTVAEANEARDEAELPPELASPGDVVKGTRLRQLARKGCCRRAARWRAKLKDARLEFVVLQEVRHGSDGIYALVLRRLESGNCVIGGYAKVHGGVGTRFERIIGGEVGQQRQLARMTFRFRGASRSFENDNGSVDPGEITYYNVVLITDGARLWTATWTDSDHKDLRAAVMTGRRLASQKKFDQALELYERAHGIQPYSPQIAAELGFVALRAGKLGLARKYCRRALRFAFGGILRGQILYNLGRISEQRGDLKRAAEQYGQSYKLRASPEVRQRLRALKRRRAAE
jgi:tetratricopeptide (TPR) repeat protein